MKALIVDDENQSRVLILHYLQRLYPDISVEEASDIREAKAILTNSSPDIIFLDVQLKSETGFDLLDQLEINHAQVIFITAHSDYAVKAFKYAAADYLLKPIDPEEFEKAVTRAVQRAEHAPSIPQDISFLKQQLQLKATVHDRLVVPTADGFHLISFSDILYCKANGNYTDIQLRDNKKMTSSYTLGHFDELLATHDFFRIHRSFLINVHHIQSYKKSEGGSVIMKDGKELEIARAAKDEFLKIFKS